MSSGSQLGLKSHKLIIHLSDGTYRYWPCGWTSAQVTPEWVMKETLPKEMQAALLLLSASEGKPVGPHMKRVTDYEYHFAPEFFSWVVGYCAPVDNLPSKFSHHPEWGPW